MLFSSFNLFPPVRRTETANYLCSEVVRDKNEFWFALHCKIIRKNEFEATN